MFDAVRSDLMNLYEASKNTNHPLYPMISNHISKLVPLEQGEITVTEDGQYLVEPLELKNVRIQTRDESRRLILRSSGQDFGFNTDGRKINIPLSRVEFKS